MKILSIETSCDDTCISILEATGGAKSASFKVLANNSNSQIKVHMPYGGVFPVLAKREHKKNLPIVLEVSLKQAKLLKKKELIDPIRGKNTLRALATSNGINAIAVTYGPGLEMCLWEGIVFAKELAEKWNVPIIPVNHMEGHILSVFGKARGKFSISNFQFPILSLLVSGGHTQLVLSRKFMQYEIIGETLDDAVGEAFDKVARMLDLPYPGGPEISRLAMKQREIEKQSLRGLRRAAGPRTEQIFQQENCDPEKISFSISLPRPMLHSKNFDFSFSGLKTAVLYLIKKIGPLNDELKSKIALEFENAAIECLVYKTQKAIEKHKIKTLIVAGGVACNTHLQNEMRKLTDKKVNPVRGREGSQRAFTSNGIKIFFPTKELAGDNSLMIGIAGYLNYIKNKKKVPKPDTIKASGNLRL